MVSCDAEGATVVLPKADEAVDEVAVVRLDALRVEMLLNDDLEEGIKLLEDSFAASGEAGDSVD